MYGQNTTRGSPIGDPLVVCAQAQRGRESDTPRRVMCCLAAAQAEGRSGCTGSGNQREDRGGIHPTDASRRQ